MAATSQKNEADTLADMKDDVPLFTLKLRRVLAGKSRVEVADYINAKAEAGGEHLKVLSTSAGTVRGWLSQGTIPKNGQIHFIAEFAGCSSDYLTDDRIPLDADPKQRPGSAPLPDSDLLARVRQRYIDEACRLTDYIKEMVGIHWYDVAIRLLDLDAEAELPPDLARAVQQAGMLPVIVSRTIGPFSLVFKADSVHENLRPGLLTDRLEKVKTIRTLQMVTEIVAIRQALAITGDDGSGVTAKIKDALKDVRNELKDLAKTQFHLVDGFFSVVYAGGLENYFQSAIDRAKQEFMPRAKKGDLPNSMSDLFDMMRKRCHSLIIEDTAFQSAYEGMADKAWREAEFARTGQPAGTEADEKEAETVRADRMTARYMLLMQMFDEFCEKDRKKLGIDK
jgi:predicted amino acid-binding ACT domain protein